MKHKSRRLRRKNRSRKIKQGGGIDERFLGCYEANLARIETAIRDTSGIHSINRGLAEQFIESQVSPIRKQAARDLVENTIYITLRETDSIVKQLVDQFFTSPAILEFYARPGNHTIYLYTSNIHKSNYFLAVLAYKYIQLHTTDVKFVAQIDNDLFEQIGTNPFLILDDVSYSGSQLSQTLYRVYWEVVAKEKEPVDHTGLTVKMVSENTPPSIFVLLTALNEASLSTISKVPIEEYKYRSSSIFLEFKPSPFTFLYLKERLYEPLLYKLGIERYLNMTILFSPMTSPVYIPYVSIYLDHKIADPVSTFTTALMYGPIIPKGIFEYGGVDEEMFFESFGGIAALVGYDSTIVKRLIDTFNEKNKTTFDTGKQIYWYVLKTLVEDDKGAETPYVLDFIPFLNTCKDTQVLLDNCQDTKVKHMDYFVFMLPEGCLEGKCSIDVPVYIEERYGDLPEKEKEDLIALHHQVNGYRCPQSWYKKGDLRMICD